MTSTGRGNLPSTSTSFEASAMQMNCRATAATIFSRQRTAAALDHHQVAGDFVGAIHVNRQLAHAVEVEYWNACRFQSLGAGFGTGDRSFDAAFHLCQFIDEEVHCGAGADTDDGAFRHQCRRGFCRCLFQCVLTHLLLHNEGSIEYT
jgi:hypothetical protein